MRAYWIGLVGLNSVFPDFGLEDSAYSKIYTEKILGILPKQEDSIKKVDELCSVIFSAAFTLLLIYSYLSVTLTIYLFIFNQLVDLVPHYILLVPGILFALLIIGQSIFVIFANLKRFKNDYRIQHFLFRWVRLTSIITYGPLYKNLLQITMVFGSNFKKKKALVRLVLFFLVSGMSVAVFKISDTNIFYLIAQKTYYENQMYLDYYHDQNPNNSFVLTPQIQSDIIEDTTVKLFIPIFSNEQNYQKDNCDIFENDNAKTNFENRIDARQYAMDCYSNYHKVILNGKSLRLDFLRKDHQTSEQMGIIAFIDRKFLQTGKNIIEVRKTLRDVRTYQWAIPFYFQPSVTR